MDTFQKDITFLSKTLVEGTTDWGYAPVTKVATFKEMNPTDRDQHKLHFKIMAIFEAYGVKSEEDGDEMKMKIDSDGIYDLTVKFIKTLLMPDEQFTVQDKTEFLNDSGALLQFGLWVLQEKIAPFFSQFKRA